MSFSLFAPPSLPCVLSRDLLFRLIEETTPSGISGEIRQYLTIHPVE